ncbi:MAG TPA: hypothetical protein VEF04_19880, partial [Blastocatellia bacterium]|nr:hypothetical protein [Blastocatellia bacterium]
VVARQLLVHLTSYLSPVCVFTCDELIEHGPKTFNGVTSTLDVLQQDILKEWTNRSASEVCAYDLLMRARAEVNKLGLKDDERGRTCIEIALKSEDDKKALELFNSASADSQWRPLAEVLQVRKVSLLTKEQEAKVQAAKPIHDDAASCTKCDRCRRFHVSVSKRPVDAEGNTGKICERCHHSHGHGGL